MSNRLNSPVARYGVALLLTAAATGARFALDPWFGEHLPFITFIPGLAWLVWFAGTGPAVAAALLGVAAANFFFIAPRPTLELVNLSSPALHLVYLTAAALIILLGHLARRRHEHGLRYRAAFTQAEARTRVIADTAPALIWESDPGETDAFASRRWFDYSTRNLNHEFGDGWLELVHPDDRAAVNAGASAFAKRRPFTTQFRQRSAGGEYRWMQDSGTPRFSGDGEFLGFIGALTDVHDRKVAEESRAWLASIVSASNAAIISKRLDGTILSWNSGAERLYGYAADEVVGQPMYVTIPPSLHDEERKILRRLAAGERVEDFVSTRIAKDGRRIEVLMTISPVYDTDGRVVGASNVGRDITEQRRAESDLRASEERYRAVVESLGEMLCRFHRNGTILFINKAYAQFAGSTAEELLGESFWQFIPEDDRITIRDMLDSLTPEHPEIRIENRFESADGSRWTLWTNRALLFDDDGRWTEAQSTGIDITDRRRAEEALRDSDRRKDAFIAILGHELRNPLAPLRTGLELLEQSGDDAPNPRDSRVLTMMDRQLTHLERLVDDLLDVSRISRGKLTLNSGPIELGLVVDAAVEQAQPLIAERMHRLVRHEAEAALTVNGDAERLTQVFANLLGNAARYASEGSVIELETTQQFGRAIVRVRDTGYGIPRERLDSLFETFSQVPEHAAYTGGGGLGVGLALARNIVELHGGEITADSEGLGKGSEFVVSLPLMPAVHTRMSSKTANGVERLPAEAVSANDAAPDAEAARATGGQRVLIVDDNADAADTLAMFLESEGHVIRTVYGSNDALTAVEDFGPAVVLLDIGLPGMDGYEVARRIRSMPQGPGLLLCAITGWGQAHDKRRAKDAGFDQHLTKPVEPAVVAAIIADGDANRAGIKVS